MSRLHDYRTYVDAYLSGVSAAELARQAGMNPGQMYRGLRSIGVSMRGRSAAGIGRTMPSGEKSASFKGGVVIDKNGYRRVRGSGKFRLEHRMIVEEAIGRKLVEGEVVHHINGDRQDNRKENLHVCTASEHRLIHVRQDALNECGNPDWRKCIYCSIYDDPAHMSVVSGKGTRYHRACAAAYQRKLKSNRRTIK